MESIVERYTYDAYGRLLVQTPGADGVFGTSDDDYAAASSVGNPYTFTARRLDSETGLMYYRARYYSPVQGRFVERDPLSYVDGVNLYTYCNSDPVNFSDPLGLKWWEWIPIVSTVGHALQNVEGDEVSYYTPCKPSRKECCDNEQAAIRACEQCVDKRAAGYMSAAIGTTGVAKDLLQGAGGTVLMLAAQNAVKQGARGAVGAAASGGVLFVDSAIDAGLLLRRAIRIRNAAQAAKKMLCICGQGK